MANPTYQSSEAKRAARAEMDAADAALDNARQAWIKAKAAHDEAQERYTAAKAATSAERRDYYRALTERRKERLAKKLAAKGEPT